MQVLSLLEKKQNRPIQCLALYLLIAALALGLKYHYSRAESTDLDWILKPTALLVEQLGGMAFERETGAGYVRSNKMIVIAPVCAGTDPPA